MKYRILVPALVWLLFVAGHLPCRADSFTPNQRTDSLLTAYDHMVEQAADYIALRQEKIDSCMALPLMPQNLLRIAELYLPYRSDSALYYYNRVIQSGDPQCAKLASIRRIRLLASIGDYEEAFRERSLLGSIPQEYKISYFDAVHRLFSEAAMTAKLDTYSREYQTQAYAYADSLIDWCQACGLRPSEYWRRCIAQANTRRDYTSALAYTDSALLQCTSDMHEYAIFAFERAVIYRDMGDVQTFYQWLLRSAIADVRCGITDNGSSWMIALEMYNRGGLDRAYKYINYSVSNANTFNAITRYQQIAPLALIISHSHEDEQSRFTLMLWGTVIALIIVMIAIIVAEFIVHKRNKELRALNRKLTQLNLQLTQLNRQLEESNMVKEQYICRYLEVYSDMIERMGHMARKTEKNPDAFLRKEMMAFYRDFDQTFLAIYPTFVNDFNALIKPEARITPKQGDMLTTELRIFALVRLGIDASAKIAQLLHYAPNTIYNYRAQMRNAALSDKDDFERQVRLIGRQIF